MSELDRDIQLADEARALNEDLPGRLTVVGGGRKGPFTLIVHRLGKRQVRTVIAAVRAILEPPTPAGSAAPRPGS